MRKVRLLEVSYRAVGRNCMWVFVVSFTQGVVKRRGNRNSRTRMASMTDRVCTEQLDLMQWEYMWTTD